MAQEIIMAGFGGQGIMLMGMLLSYAGMKEGKYVSWMPSYGPEMRGGTANCSVVVSDLPVASPVVTEPTTLVAMNRPSLEKFGPAVVQGGVIIINSSLVEKGSGRSDVRDLLVPANEIANELGNSRVANMVTLGTLVAATGCVSLEAVVDSLKKVLPEHRHDLIPVNKRALEKGFSLLS